jgi:low affinity Fe/Cu permease
MLESRLQLRNAGDAKRAPFFVACVLLVLLWAPSFWLFPNMDTWQLVINPTTTIVTFLMVAHLQNSQHRAEQAIHQKLDAVADGSADFMEHLRRRWWTSAGHGHASESSRRRTT